MKKTIPLFAFLFLATFVWAQDDITPPHINRNLSDTLTSIEVPTSSPTEDNAIYELIETPPSLVGGHKALLDWINQNLHYPKGKEDIVGKVVLKFVIEKDGRLTNVKILKGIDDLFNAEALRLIENMPKWLPGKQSGVIVKSYFTLPISFKLSE